MRTVWEIFSERLNYIHWVYGAKIHLFVLMNNHFHLVISTPHSNLSEIMAHFMRETTRSLNGYSGRINQAYGARHFRSILETQHYYLLAYKYIYRNPVEAGLTTTCEAYPFSSLNFLLGDAHASFSVEYDDTLFSDIEGTLSWLNKDPKEAHLKSVAKALQKQRFKLAKDDRNRPHSLETTLL